MKHKIKIVNFRDYFNKKILFRVLCYTPKFHLKINTYKTDSKQLYWHGIEGFQDILLRFDKNEHKNFCTGGARMNEIPLYGYVNIILWV